MEDNTIRIFKSIRVWAYLDCNYLVDFVLAALVNNMTVDYMKKDLIKENPGHEITFKVQ